MYNKEKWRSLFQEYLQAQSLGRFSYSNALQKSDYIKLSIPVASWIALQLDYRNTQMDEPSSPQLCKEQWELLPPKIQQRYSS